MNARLSSLLVAGGVVLAGIQAGSLLAAPAALESQPVKAATAHLESASLTTDGAGASILLRVPGFAGRPGLQVFHAPFRVVVDLPGVQRGTQVSRKELDGLKHPLIHRVRLGQFAAMPHPVTRLVLDVVPGTQAIVMPASDGIQIRLMPGEGKVQAHMEGFDIEPARPIVEPTVVTAQLKTPPAPVATPARPLAPLPSVGSAFQTLPSLAAATVLSAATPEPAQAQPAAQAPPATEAAPRNPYAGRTLGDDTPKYTGSRMTIDLQNTDIREFLRILADTGHLNLVMDPDVQGNYGYRFTDTPWDQILDVVLKNAGLGKEIQNGVLRVAKVEKLQKEAEERKKLEETRALAGSLQTITRPLSYAKVSDVQNIIKNMLTKRGSVILDDRTNTLIITDLPSNIKVLDQLLQTLDVQISQVQIEARIVEANKNWQRAFGVVWPQANSGATAITGSTGSTTGTPWVGTQSPYWNGVQGFNRTASGQSAAVAWAPGLNGVTSIPSPAGEFWFSFLSDRFSINAVLQALESEGVVKIVSSPKVVTQNNKKATILSGEKIPYPTQQGGAQGGAITVAFVDANLQLDVTPQITNEGTIIMDIKLEKAEADFSRTVNGTPTIIRKALDTQVLVRDGGTAVLGGVYVTNTTTGSAGVPFLSKIPFLGALFRNKSKQTSDAELLIFITPHVLRG
jgi:type IV pilus assembly protein PilQ